MRQDGRSRGDIRQEIDEQIMALVKEAGSLNRHAIQREIDAPREQVWHRIKTLVQRRHLAWNHKQLCLYEDRPPSRNVGRWQASRKPAPAPRKPRVSKVTVRSLETGEVLRVENQSAIAGRKFRGRHLPPVN